MLSIFTIKPGIRDFCSHMILLDFYIWKIKIFFGGKILGYSAITDHVLTCRFSGSILFSHLLMFPEGFLVLVKIKMVGEGGGYFCS